MFLIRYLLSSSFLKNIFFIAVFLIFLLFMLLIFLNVFTRNNQSIEVPNLVGKSIDQFDVDKDGCLNWDEFCTLCQQNKMDDQQCKKWWHIFSRPFSKRYRFESCKGQVE